MRTGRGDGDVPRGWCRLALQLKAPHAPLPNLAQPAALPQQRKGAGDEVGGEAVERKAQPARAEQPRRAKRKGGAVAGAEHAGEAEAAQVGVLEGPPGAMAFTL